MKALITITTCNRLSDVKKYIWNYLEFCNKNQDFQFVLALDGKEQAYIDFCEEYAIPLVYSEEREGVGLSKNRVLTQFPNFEYYFFVEDDVELINNIVFSNLIEIHHLTGYLHFCSNHLKNLIKTEIYGAHSLSYSSTGGAQLAFYHKEGITKVGGFNTLFAKYKRFGHTEHSYRFYNAKLQPAPFIFAEDFLDMVLVHNPVSVSQNNISTNENELIQEEQDLIDAGSTYFPLETLSPFYFNQQSLGFNQIVADFLKNNPQKYPLTSKKERKKALGEFYALKINKKNSHFKNLKFAIKSFVYSPMNNELKHAVKFYNR